VRPSASSRACRRHAACRCIGEPAIIRRESLARGARRLRMRTDCSSHREIPVASLEARGSARAQSFVHRAGRRAPANKRGSARRRRPRVTRSSARPGLAVRNEEGESAARRCALSAGRVQPWAGRFGRSSVEFNSTRCPNARAFVEARFIGCDSGSGHSSCRRVRERRPGSSAADSPAARLLERSLAARASSTPRSNCLSAPRAATRHARAAHDRSSSPSACSSRPSWIS